MRKMLDQRQKAEYIKIKKYQKLKTRILNFFQILHLVEKLIYKFKLSK